MRPKIVILASGDGTTAEAFIRASATGTIDSEVGLIIVSRPTAGIFDRLASLNKELKLSIESLLISQSTHLAQPGEAVAKGFQTKAEEMAILDTIKNGNFDLVALMGYMKRIGPNLIKEFGWQEGYTSIYQASMLNTHPGILPDTKAMYGSQIQSYVLEHHLPYGGQTLHLVSEEYDDGPILAEHRVPVEPGDTPETLFERVQKVEKKYVPIDIDAFVKARISFNSA